MKRVIPWLVLGVVLVAGCERHAASLQRKFETRKRHYVIEQYSGGVKIKEYRFTGILNDSKDSDGYYWFVGDTLYEVSGDLTIRSWP